MPIYFTPRQIPELSGLPRGEREELWRKAGFSALGHWQTWAAVAACPMLLDFVRRRLLPQHPKDCQLYWGLAILVAGFFCAQVVFEMTRPRIRELLAEKRRRGPEERS